MYKTFSALALGGGGVKGVLHIGALRELQKHQPLFFKDGIYGSSIGSIVATYLAFELPLEGIEKDIKKYLSMEKVVPKFGLSAFQSIMTSKGAFSMDLFEKNVIEFFESKGLDIRNKRISDSNMPLYIISSNITKQVPVVFSANVPLLDALKCSCCIPGIFKPQELYGDLYVDGGLMVVSMSQVIPDDKETLILNLGKTVKKKITKSTIDTISALEYASSLYSMSMNQVQISQKTENTLHLRYPNLFSDSDLEDFMLDNLIASSEKQMKTFLGTTLQR